jgi:hypothetical protein
MGGGVADTVFLTCNFSTFRYVSCMTMNTRFSAAKTSDPVIQHQLFMIHQIIHDETWLEGERRGCRVSPQDRVVRENVCGVVLRIGQHMRDRLTEAHWEMQHGN